LQTPVFPKAIDHAFRTLPACFYRRALAEDKQQEPSAIPRPPASGQQSCSLPCCLPSGAGCASGSREGAGEPHQPHKSPGTQRSKSDLPCKGNINQQELLGRAKLGQGSAGAQRSLNRSRPSKSKTAPEIHGGKSPGNIMAGQRL
uniref:Uncharacterized protein n=1 Tax=Calidris pygmaea TaxID=425635 RepID=A0A8C3KDB6_9CHAR